MIMRYSNKEIYWGKKTNIENLGKLKQSTYLFEVTIIIIVSRNITFGWKKNAPELKS